MNPPLIARILFAAAALAVAGAPACGRLAPGTYASRSAPLTGPPVSEGGGGGSGGSVTMTGQREGWSTVNGQQCYTYSNGGGYCR